MDNIETLDLRVVISLDPTTRLYRIVVSLPEVSVSVKVEGADVRSVFKKVATKCTEELCGLGYAVRANEVIGAIEGALENAAMN